MVVVFDVIVDVVVIIVVIVVVVNVAVVVLVVDVVVVYVNIVVVSNACCRLVVRLIEVSGSPYRQTSISGPNFSLTNDFRSH